MRSDEDEDYGLEEDSQEEDVRTGVAEDIPKVARTNFHVDTQPPVTCFACCM